MVWKRIATGLALGLGSIALVWWGVLPITLEVWALSMLGIREFYRLAAAKGIRPSLITGWVAVTALTVEAYSRPAQEMVYVISALMLWVMVVFLFRKDFHISVMLDAGATALGIFYVGFLFSFIVALRKLPGTFHLGGIEGDRGAGWVILLIFGTALFDTAAYFGGKSFGRTKLWPQVSPGKTVEGTLCGVLASVGVTCWWGRIVGLPLRHAVALGVLMAVMALLGDLWESVLKRDAGMKDSGQLLAGHGGVLDRFDSILFTAPVVYLYVMLFHLFKL